MNYIQGVSGKCGKEGIRGMREGSQGNAGRVSGECGKGLRGMGQGLLLCFMKPAARRTYFPFLGCTYFIAVDIGGVG